MYFIHYSCYKQIEYVWRGIKTNPRPKNSTAPDRAPPVLKFLDPLLVCIVMKDPTKINQFHDPQGRGTCAKAWSYWLFVEMHY